MKNKMKIIEDYAEDIAPRIYGLATVPDDWINRLKAYWNINIDENTGSAWIITICLYIHLLIARTEDLLTAEESRYLEDKCKDVIFRGFKLIDFYGQKNTEKQEVQVSRIINKTIDVLRDGVKRGDNLAQIYIHVLIKSFGNKLSEEIVQPYAISNIELFEKQKFREKLAVKLGVLS